MLHSDKYALSIAMKKKISKRSYSPITDIEAATLEKSLREDAVSLAQVAIATLFEGLNGVKHSRFTWSKIKLYYATFYAIRSMLMIRGVSIFYMGSSPHSLKSFRGETAKSRKGNTHSAAHVIFKEEFPSHILLSQEIGGIDPLEWIENKRNDASYRFAPMIDPETPDEFRFVVNRFRATISAYLKDPDLLYAFDADHAMIAFPILTITELSKYIEHNLKDTQCVIDKHFVDILTNSDCNIADFRRNLPIYNFADRTID